MNGLHFDNDSHILLQAGRATGLSEVKMNELRFDNGSRIAVQSARAAGFSKIRGRGFDKMSLWFDEIERWANSMAIAVTSITSSREAYEQWEKELLCGLGIPAELIKGLPRSSVDATRSWLEEREARIKNLLAQTPYHVR